MPTLKKRLLSWFTGLPARIRIVSRDLTRNACCIRAEILLKDDAVLVDDLTGFGWSRSRMRGGKKADQPAAGVLFDLGPHVIDQALVLFGEPRAITASAFCERETSKVDDSFDVCLEYAGLRAMGRARIIAYAPGPHFLIHGTKGSFVKYGMNPRGGAINILKAQIGVRIGVKKRKSCGAH